MSDTYNGWANYETWNVALWIGNDEGLYSLARGFSSYRDFQKALRRYAEETESNSSWAIETPDGVAWNDSGLDVAALDEMMSEL